MGKDAESRLAEQPLPKQFRNIEFMKPPFYLGMHTTSTSLEVPCNNDAFRYSRLPISEPGQLKEPKPHGSLISSNSLHEKFLPKIDLHQKFPTVVNNVCGEATRFLVFDQTGTKITMMFSSWSPNPTGTGHPREGKLGFGTDMHHNCEPILTDESDDDHVTNEDSEEIDALLYSDDEGNYSEDTEEASTGHSPSSLSARENAEDTDEVASSYAHPFKRQKLSDAETSVIPNTPLDYEDDTESSCGGGKPLLSLSDSKKVKDEKIRETVSILQTIIPGMKGSKDAVMILDGAIDYLRTLKCKAKSLGF